MELFFIDHECEAFFELTKCCCVFKLFKCIRTFFVFHFFFVNLLLLPYKVHCVFTNNSNVLFAIMSMNNGAQVEDPKKKKKKERKKECKATSEQRAEWIIGNWNGIFILLIVMCRWYWSLSQCEHQKKRRWKILFFLYYYFARHLFPFSFPLNRNTHLTFFYRNHSQWNKTDICFSSSKW